MEKQEKSKEMLVPSGGENSHKKSDLTVEDSMLKNGDKVCDGAACLPKSDAVLNCPACMTTLCLDCQRYILSPCYVYF